MFWIDSELLEVNLVLFLTAHDFISFVPLLNFDPLCKCNKP